MNRDWVCEISQTVGTGTYDLGGPPAGTSYFAFSDRYLTADNSITYFVVNATRTKWEKNRFGTLTHGSPDTLTRAVVESTEGDAAVSWIGSDLPLRIYVAPDANPQAIFASAPQAKVADFTLAPGESSIINNKSSGCVMTSTPTIGRHLLVQNYTAQTLTSNAANVQQKGGATTTTAILPATIGAWAYLVGTGSAWRIMMSGT